MLNAIMQTKQEEKKDIIKKDIKKLQMTDNKRVLVPIGLTHWNYKTFIAPELFGQMGRWWQQI